LGSFAPERFGDGRGVGHIDRNKSHAGVGGGRRLLQIEDDDGDTLLLQSLNHCAADPS
jgi:hypothetical protein